MEHSHLATYLSVASTINGIDAFLFVVAVLAIAGWVTSSLELRARQARVDDALISGPEAADLYDRLLGERRHQTQLYDWAVDGL